MIYQIEKVWLRQTLKIILIKTIDFSMVLNTPWPYSHTIGDASKREWSAIRGLTPRNFWENIWLVPKIYFCPTLVTKKLLNIETCSSINFLAFFLNVSTRLSTSSKTSDVASIRLCFQSAKAKMKCSLKRHLHRRSLYIAVTGQSKRQEIYIIIVALRENTFTFGLARGHSRVRFY
jgi:hypothetical protein